MPAPRVAKLPVGTLAKLSRSMREDLGVSNLPHGFFNDLPTDVVLCGVPQRLSQESKKTLRDRR